MDSNPTLAAAAADKLAETLELVPIVELDEYPEASWSESLLDVG